MRTYTTKDNTYFVKPKDNPKDLIEKEIGDSKTPDKFLPQQKIMRWDNECNVSVRLIHDEKTPVVSTEGDKVLWKGDKVEAHFYDIPDGEGASEFEVILKEKPKTNKVEFTLVDKDVDYFYQPKLTQKEKDDGASRPENVVGSYAVYAKTPKTNWTGGKEYKCGKIGHIYRPKIIDSAGTEVWGDLHIENGVLSVTIPQDFLDKAIYPVRHAAGLTFGYTSNGVSSYFESAASPDTSGITYTPASNGSVDSMSLYAYQNGNHAKMAIYNGTTFVAQMNAITLPATIGWTTGTINGSGSVSSAVAYYLAFNLEYASYINYDATDTYVKYASLAYASAWPSTISWSTSGSRKLQYSIYATYTASGGSTPPSIESNLVTFN